MITGEKVYLTTIENEDLEVLRQWRNQPEYRKYFREYREISKHMQETWYQSKVIGDPNTIMFAIKNKATNELLGCCGLCYINWINRHGDLSLYIGWENSYIDELGFAQEACRLLFNYGFSELNLNKVWTEIYEFDHKKYKLYHSLGFHDDGLLRQQYFHDGKLWDSYILSLLRKDWKSLSIG